VDDDVLAGLERLRGEVELGLVGCGDDDEVDGGVGEGFVDGAEDARGGVGLGGFVALALDDRSQFQGGDGGDEGAVEDFSGEAEAEDCAADGSVGCGGHADYGTTSSE